MIVDRIDRVVAYLLRNKEWLFSGLGISLAGGIVAWLRARLVRREAAPLPQQQTVNVTVTGPVRVDEEVTSGHAWRRRHLISNGVAPSAADLKVGGVEDVIEWGWDGVRLLREFIRLDFETLDGLQEEHEGSPEQWAPVFVEHPDTWRMLYTSPRCVAGYWHFAPLFEREFSRALTGQLLDSEITVDKVRNFEFPGTYDLYFVQVCLMPRWRCARNIQMLFATVLDVVEELARQGVFFDRLCTNAYTATGLALCRTFRLSEACRHRGHGTIFAGFMKEVLQSDHLAFSRVALRELYGVGGAPRRNRVRLGA